MMITPISRTQEYHIQDDGRKSRICYALHNPHHFLDTKTGLFLPINMAAIDTAAKSTIGDITKKSANIRSIGIRQDLASTKLFGVRPDFDQSGKYQFEVSPVSLKINSIDGSISAAKCDSASPIQFDMGGFSLLHNRHFTRFCVPATGKTESFELRLRLDMTGLDPVYRADLDEYWIYTASGEFFCRLRKPLLIDPDTLQNLDVTHENLQRLNLLGHDLQQAKDGSWEYVKYSQDALAKVGVDAYLIDADIYYSTTADGKISFSDADWATCHGSGTGSAASGDSASIEMVRAAKSSGIYYLIRSFFMFDTSAVISPIACALNIYGYTNGNCDVCAQKGTQEDTLVSNDFDAFSGSSYGAEETWSTSGYNTIDFNAGGVADINTAGNTKVCCRDLLFDYNNSAPTISYRSGGYYANNTGTDKDPYLEITEGTGSPLPIFVYHYNQARI